jgi:hypothetical protein
MYERFTADARWAMQVANQEAMRFQHEYIGTEHILLGLTAEESSVAAVVLANLGLEPDAIRREVERLIQAGRGKVEKMPPTPRAKKVIEYAIEEARNFKHDHVGTEHLLLGLLREEEGVAGQVLNNLGLQPEAVRREVLSVLATRGPAVEGGAVIPGAAQDQPVPSHLQDHPLVRQMVRLIDTLNTEKEESVARQDFENAAAARDHADAMRTSLHWIVRMLNWKPDIGKDPKDDREGH